MGDLMDSIMSLQTTFQQVSHLAKGPGATKLIALKPLLESSSSELEKKFDQILQLLERHKSALILAMNSDQM